jgi:hypothetical protein
MVLLLLLLLLLLDCPSRLALCLQGRRHLGPMVATIGSNNLQG